MLSSSIRILHLIDCLINGLSHAGNSTALIHAMIVTSTQDNLCSLVQLVPDAFELEAFGTHRLRKLCYQLLQNVTADDELIR